MDFEELSNQLNAVADEALNNAKTYYPERLGLDRRAAYQVWRGYDFLAIRSNDKQTMEYYGGFEYVDRQYVLDTGYYTFYSTDDGRVMTHWERAAEPEEHELCSSCNGSGEGRYDGTICASCGGRGTEKGERDEG